MSDVTLLRADEDDLSFRRMTWDSLARDRGQRLSIFTDNDEHGAAVLSIVRGEDGELALEWGFSGRLESIATSTEAMLMFLARVGQIISAEFAKREGTDA